MYLRAIHCHLKPEADRQEAEAVYRELLPAIEAHPGYLGASLMLNEQAHMAVAFIYWDTREHGCQAGEMLRPLLFQHTWNLTDAPLDITGYAVLHHTMVEPN